MARRNAVEFGHRPGKPPVSAMGPTMGPAMGPAIGSAGGTPPRTTGFGGRLRAALRGKASPVADLEADRELPEDRSDIDDFADEPQDLVADDASDDTTEDRGDDVVEALDADLDDDAADIGSIDVDDELATVEDDSLSVDAELSDNVGGASVEINVESLLAQLEEDQPPVSKATPACSARRKLEDYMERKRIARALEDFEDFEVE